MCGCPLAVVSIRDVGLELFVGWNFCRLRFTTLMRILRNLRAEEFTLHISFSIFTVLMHGVSTLYISKWYIPNSKIMKVLLRNRHIADACVVYFERRANKYTWKKWKACVAKFHTKCVFFQTEATGEDLETWPTLLSYLRRKCILTTKTFFFIFWIFQS